MQSNLIASEILHLVERSMVTRTKANKHSQYQILINRYRRKYIRHIQENFIIVRSSETLFYFKILSHHYFEIQPAFYFHIASFLELYYALSLFLILILQQPRTSGESQTNQG